MRTRYKTYADYGMLKSDEEKTRERCMKASAEISRYMRLRGRWKE